MLLDDPPAGTSISSDPDDDYLVALARAGGADCLVSGDADLTVLIDAKPPVVTPREFLERVHAARVSGTGRGDDVVRAHVMEHRQDQRCSRRCVRPASSVSSRSASAIRIGLVTVVG
jgi:hypothetical protein